MTTEKETSPLITIRMPAQLIDQLKSPQRATLLVKGGGTAWLDGNVSSRSRPIYNHAVDRSRESATFSVLG